MATAIAHLRGHVHIVPLIGAPGAGKEKKGLILAHLLSGCCMRLITSDEIRSARTYEGTDEHCLFIKALLQDSEEQQRAGKLVDDAPVLHIFEHRVRSAHEIHAAKLIIWDGFPRNMGQAKHLIKCRLPYSAIHLDISYDECLRRVEERARKNGPRDDDREAPRRYRDFEKETLPAIRILKRHDVHSVLPVNGTLPVRDQVMRMLRFIKEQTSLVRIDLGAISAMLDHPGHPAREVIDEMEGRIPKKLTHPQPILSRRMLVTNNPVQQTV